MKKILFTLALTFIGLHAISAQVGIGTETPHDSSQLELKSTTKGFLPPRMTEDERNNISSPAQGLMIYCINCCTNGEAQVYNGTEWTNMTGGPAALPPSQVGDFREGGVVFYIFQNGDPGYVVGETHGLVSAIQDQSSGIQWDNGSNSTTGATATGIGAGQTNTTAIVNDQGADDYAASVCDNHSVTIGATTYGDWFLPSKDELNLMYQNIGPGNALGLGNIGGFASAYYWSSTEVDNSGAWGHNFGYDEDQFLVVDEGPQLIDSKNFTNRVRAVRAF